MVDQLICAHNINGSRLGLATKDTVHQHISQQALCFCGVRIERQRLLEKPDCTGIVVRRPPAVCGGSSAKNVVQHIGMFGWPCGLRGNQLSAEYARNASRYVVLHGK